MPVSTSSAALHITPVVLKTLFDHYKRKGKKFEHHTPERAATDDIFFDQGFHIVKAFLDMATHNTVESLQKFASTHIPSPYWSAVSQVLIPLSTCNRAADILIEWFGKEEIDVVVGGERWWQVRGTDGIDAEWITENECLSDGELPDKGRKLSKAEEKIVRMDSVEPVMFYIPGGGYYFGSTNTHRYQILHYAHKFHGRAFAVNYRKAPQYPFPCAIQDVLAAYLYMIDPPPHALHTAISPSKIVFAGDSAGGALCINLLCILRDMGLPMPAGAVLISPWIDLTHSFPSVTENVDTDIIPPHGFMAKPSTLWPVNPLPEHKDGRVITSTSNPPPKPGHPDTLKPDAKRTSQQTTDRTKGKEEGAVSPSQLETQKEMLNGQTEQMMSGKNEDPPGKGTNRKDKADLDQEQSHGSTEDVHPEDQRTEEMFSYSAEDQAEIRQWEPKPPKVLMDDANAKPLELRSQIQLYATNEQLCHPACSPILQGSLGNLCPLYIIAGAAEAVRDEVIYLAHRAADPEKYKVRAGAISESKRHQEDQKKFTTPTKVHLQVYDDMCHVLTVFTFTDAAKYAYRSIAQFVRHVTSHSAEHLARNPFPELHRPQAPIPPDSSEETFSKKPKLKHKLKHPVELLRPTPSQQRQEEPGSSDIALYRSNEHIATEEVQDHQASKGHGSSHGNEENGNESEEDKDIPDVVFIRERVDINGEVRPLEPPEEIDILQFHPSRIGIIKEAPVQRWLAGQAEWDKKYKSSAGKIKRRRRKNEAKAVKMLQHASERGLVMVEDTPFLKHLRSDMSEKTNTTGRTVGQIQEDRRWGPLDLDEERVPSTAICRRRDTPEALALLKKNIYNTAPVTHRTVPKVTIGDSIKAIMDSNDRAFKPPKQSVTEEQQRTAPMHGLSMWSGLVGSFLKQSSAIAKHGAKDVEGAISH